MPEYDKESILVHEEDISPFIPKVTTSRKDFINYIFDICEKYNEKINIKKLEAGIKWIESGGCYGHYFCGMIFIERVSFRIIHHELMHHIAFKLRAFTHSNLWYWIDMLTDTLTVKLTLIKTKLECMVMNLFDREHYHYVYTTE